LAALPFGAGRVSGSRRIAADLGERQPKPSGAAAEDSLLAPLDTSGNNGNNSYMAPKRKPRPTGSATSALRQAIAECGLSFNELERRSGLKRQSLMKFARGEQSIRLDLADRLLECFGLQVVKKRRGK